MAYSTFEKLLAAAAILLGLISAAAASDNSAGAGESPESAQASPSSAEIVAKLLESGEDGQMMITYEDDKKTIKTIYVVAVSPLSHSYTKSRAQKKAATLARVSAEQTLVKFFNSKVNTSTSVALEMRDSVSSASSETRISETFSSKSSALLASLMKVATDPDRMGSYVAVFVWNNKVTEGAKKTSAAMSRTYKATLSE